MKLGDVYTYVSHEGKPKGVITYINHEFGMITVSFDKGYIPQTMDYPEYCFTNGTFVPFSNEKPKCVCGTTITLGKDDHPIFHDTDCEVRIWENG